MKAMKSNNGYSAALYGAILAAFWTVAFGWFMWILGWIFSATSIRIDMNLGNWTVYSMKTFIAVTGRALFFAAGGALAGLVVAVLYNLVAGMMGGLKIIVK